jgi:hypothetical protein
MRRVLDLVALVALVTVWAMTAYAIFGPHPLPLRVPTHFDFMGKPDGWGSPQVLWLLPSIGVFFYALMALVSRFPGAFNYPVRVPPANRVALQHLALRMIAWLNAEVICLFAGIQYVIIKAASGSLGGFSPYFFLIALVFVFGTIGWHIVEMRQTARMSLPR